PTVIDLTSISGGPDSPWQSPPTHNAGNYPTGNISFSNVQSEYYPGLQTDQIICVLHFTAVGSTGQTTVLDLQDGPLGGGVSLTDADGEPITTTITDGSVTIVAPASPAASFTIDDPDWTVDAGQVIQFTDTSTSPPTSWAWDFSYDAAEGFQIESTDQHPTWTYYTPGSYAVALQVSNAVGSDDTIGDAGYTITVEPGPLHTLTVNPSNVTLGTGSQQAFTATGRDQHDNVISGITWDWAVVNGGGTIDASGVFTAGDVIATYENTVQATGTHKGSTKSGTAT
ncbi:PKD domain-containing protein, partial [Chloroflexota bacterium]